MIGERGVQGGSLGKTGRRQGQPLAYTHSLTERKPGGRVSRRVAMSVCMYVWDVVKHKKMYQCFFPHRVIVLSCLVLSCLVELLSCMQDFFLPILSYT